MSIFNANPFVGLRPFESDESLLFFGRQEQTLELLQSLHEHHFVAVIGSSGSGKSSLIRAGLIPRLKAGYLVDNRDHWMIVMTKPGQSPLYNLAAALLSQLGDENADISVTGFIKRINEEGAEAIIEVLRPLWEERNTNVFILVDQFEELFRFSMQINDVEKKDEAIEFVNILLELSRKKNLPIYLVLTMRSDFTGDCAQFFGLPEAMNESQYLVPRLNRLQLKNAIEGPVKLYGAIINPSLVTRLLNDSQDFVDELPLLQHALMRAWDREMSIDKNGELDLNDYKNIGGLEKALSNHADEALQGMSENELALTKKIFKALTNIDENGRKVRRPVLLKDLEAITGAGKKELLAIINKFNEDKRSFLVINKSENTDDLLIDISHESLIRQWNTLSNWVDEEAESSKMYLRLVESAKLFREHKKDLMGGSELHLALEWYDTHKPRSAWALQYNPSFDEGIKYLEESKEDWKIQQQKKKAGKRNQRILMGGGIVVLLVFSFFYYRAQLERKQEQIDSHSREDRNIQNANSKNKATTLDYLARQFVSRDPTLALQLEARAMDTVKGVDSLLYTQILQQAQDFYDQDNALYKIVYRGKADSAGLGVIVLPDSKNVAFKILRLSDPLIKKIKTGSKTDIASVVFSPDGQRAMASFGDGSAGYMDPAGSFIPVKKNPGEKIMALAMVHYKLFGDKMLAASDKAVELWNLDGTSRHIYHYSHVEGSIVSIAISGDRTRIFTASSNSMGRIWSADAGDNITLVKEFNLLQDDIKSAAFSHDGNLILTGSKNNTVRLWNAAGNLVKEFKGHTGSVTAVAFSPDDRIVYTGSLDGTLREWHLPDVTPNPAHAENGLAAKWNMPMKFESLFGKNILDRIPDSMLSKF